jgi:hypothetical protein
MKSKYVLISFYPVKLDNKNVWPCYGHIHAGYNESLGEFKTKQQALDACLSYGVPVMLSGNVSHVVEKLQGKETNVKPKE